MSLFYLSFADPGRRRDAQFLGAAIVRAQTMPEAVKAAHALGINPGGEVVGHLIVGPLGGEIGDMPEEFIGVLMGTEKLERLSNWAIGL